MAFDTKAWLKDLGFTDNEIADLEPKFHPRAGDLEKHQLRQSDYSRFVNEYKTKNEQLAEDYRTKNDQLTQEMADWASVQATTQAEQQQKQAALDALEQEKLRLTQAVTRLAEQAGVDPKTVLTGDPVPPKKDEPKPAAFDPSPVYGAIGGVTEFLLGMMGSMPAMADEHYRLTGERLDTRKIVEEVKARAAKKEAADPVAIWESLYDIPAKRTAAQQKAHDDEIKAAEQRGREAARSEAAIPGTQSPGIHAPIFGGRESALKRPQPGGNTAKFAQALASGKYRQPVPAHEGGAGTR